MISPKRRRTNILATPKGFEPSISTVTGWHVRPLHHGAAATSGPRPLWAGPSGQLHSISGLEPCQSTDLPHPFVVAWVAEGYNGVESRPAAAGPGGQLPRRPRSRARPAASRRKARHYPPAALPTPRSESGSTATPRMVTFPDRGRPPMDATPSPARARVYDYGYVLGELRRIAIIGGVTLLLVVVLSFVLR
jgi:hypothetical protein